MNLSQADKQVLVDVISLWGADMPHGMGDLPAGILELTYALLDDIHGG